MDQRLHRLLIILGLVFTVGLFVDARADKTFYIVKEEAGTTGELNVPGYSHGDVIPIAFESQYNIRLWMMTNWIEANGIPGSCTDQHGGQTRVYTWDSISGTNWGGVEYEYQEYRDGSSMWAAHGGCSPDALKRNYMRGRTVTCPDGMEPDFENGLACGDPPPEPVCGDFEGQEKTFSYPATSGWQYPNQSSICYPVNEGLNCTANLGGKGLTLCGEYGGQQICTYSSVVITASECGTPESVVVPPADDGCVTGADGKTVCINPDGTVTTTFPDGSETTTPPPDTGIVCGEQNGTVVCVGMFPGGASCEYANGESICIDGNGTEIDPTSPDHPNNGGNGDGDNTNDPLDPNNGSDTLGPAEQVEFDSKAIVGAINQQTMNQIAADQQLQLDHQEFLTNNFLTELPDSEGQGSASSNIANINATSSGIETTLDSEIDSLSDATTGSGYLTGQTSGMDSAGAQVEGMFFSGECTDYVVAFGNFDYALRCDDFAVMRRGMEIFFGGLLLIYAFNVLTGSIREIK